MELAQLATAPRTPSPFQAHIQTCLYILPYQIVQSEVIRWDAPGGSTWLYGPVGIHLEQSLECGGSFSVELSASGGQTGANVVVFLATAALLNSTSVP